MGRLITESVYSEITATLERLDEFGVTANGFKRIRTMSPALLKQLSYYIENGVSKYGDTLPGLYTFDVSLDSRNTDSIKKEMTQRKIFQSTYVIKDILEKSTELPVEKKKFIALSLDDFGMTSSGDICESLLSKKWLRNWSDKNILGNYYLTPCTRADSAIHIALTIDNLDLRRMILVYGDKKDSWITVDRDGWSGSSVSDQKVIFNTRVDFSYNCPAIFELHEI